jgi:DNA-directed RNA polymerase specialized sigma24 family protein
MDSIKQLRRKLDRYEKAADDLLLARDELELAVYQVKTTEKTSGAAIARALDVNANTVKVWLKRGRELAEERAGRHSDAPDRPGRGS